MRTCQQANQVAVWRCAGRSIFQDRMADGTLLQVMKEGLRAARLSTARLHWLSLQPALTCHATGPMLA
jgi:hypothetical protein